MYNLIALVLDRGWPVANNRPSGKAAMQDDMTKLLGYLETTATGAVDYTGERQHFT